MTYQVILVKDMSQLRRVLKEYAVPSAGWRKTRKQLLTQILAGESVLCARKGTLYRFTWRAQANAYRVTPKGREEKLFETEQIVNGRHRKPTKRVSVSEKMMVFPIIVKDKARAPETALQAIVRCFFEELGVLVRQKDFTPLRRFVMRPKRSRSFPIPVINCIFLFEFFFAYNKTKETYVEIRERKKTTWGWGRSRRRRK